MRLHLKKYSRRFTAVKNKKKKLVLIVCHSLFLLAFSIMLQYSSRMRNDEISFLKYAFILKHLLLKKSPKPVGDSVLFIDVARDISLIEDPDEQNAYGGAMVSIVDRVKLASLFKILANNPGSYKFIICDVLLNDPSPDDDSLKKTIEALPRFITASSFSQGAISRPVFNVVSGCVNYDAVGSSFVKIPIYFSDTVKSLPALLTEMEGKKKFSQFWGLTYANNRLTFNYIIPEFYYRKTDFEKNLQPLGKLLLFDNDEIVRLTSGKWIIIGDYSKDIHETYAGNLPGSLILFNSFLTLSNKPLIITWGWIIFSFTIFFALSTAIIVFPKARLEGLVPKIKLPLIIYLLKKYISYIGILIVVNIISYPFFGVFISLLYLGSYFTVLEYLIDNYDSVKKLWKS